MERGSDTETHLSFLALGGILLTREVLIHLRFHFIFNKAVQ